MAIGTAHGYFDRIFWLFCLQDGLSGLYGVIEATRLQSWIERLMKLK